MDAITLNLKNFLLEYSDNRSFLLGMSGGSDSTALFYLLLRSGHPFQVAHINHNWRKESGEEADALFKLCEKEKIPFFLHTIMPPQFFGNKEDVARKIRLKFFEELCLLNNLQGVILGHHADDQAETVLKRLFEGASIPNLKGLSMKSEHNKLTIFRPLLNYKKKDILQWLSNQRISFFEDNTNWDTEFLRARMRQTLIPELSRIFGKEIASNLAKLASAAAELDHFLETQLLPYREQIVHESSRVFLSFKNLEPTTSFLWKAVLRDFFACCKITLSQTVIDAVYFHLKNFRGVKELLVRQGTIQINRREVVFIKKQSSL